MSDEVIAYYASAYKEADRLTRGEHRFEFLRTKEIISRYLGDAPQVIFDIGGADRVRALAEARRLLRPGGLLFAAAISRFASLLDTFRTERIHLPEVQPVVEADLATGVHRSPPGKNLFTTAYFHRAGELRTELLKAGLDCEKIIGIESPLFLLSHFDDWLDEAGAYQALALHFARQLEEEPSLLGASAHLLAVARKPFDG